MKTGMLVMTAVAVFAAARCPTPLSAQEDPPAAEKMERLLTRLRSEDLGECRAAAEELAKLGPGAAPGVPILVEQARKRRGAAKLPFIRPLSILGRDFPAARAVLLGFLQDESPIIPGFTLQLIAEAGLDTEDIVFGLTDVLFSANELVAGDAAAVLCGLGERAAAAVPRILARAEPGKEVDAYDLTERLEDLVPAVPGALDALIGLLEHPDKEVRFNAAFSLRDLAGSAVEAVPALVKALSARNGELELAGIDALASIGPDALSAMPDLRERLSGEIAAEAAWAIAAVGMGSRKDKLTLLALEALVEDPDPDVRAASRYARWALSGNTGGVVPALLERIRAPFNGRRDYFAALGIMGSDAKEAIPALRKYLDPGWSRPRRDEATLALCRIDPANEVPKLAERLDSKDAEDRIATLRLLQQLGVLAGPVAGIVRSIAEDEQEPKEIRGAAESALEAIE